MLVLNGDGSIVFIQDLGRAFFINNAAEDAIFHDYIQLQGSCQKGKKAHLIEVSIHQVRLGHECGTGLFFIFFTPDECLGHFTANIIFELLWRSLHEIGRGCDKRTADPAVQCQFHAANRINHHTGGIG